MLLFHALLCTDDGGTRRLQNSVRGQGMEGSPQADVEQDSGECGFSDAERPRARGYGTYTHTGMSIRNITFQNRNPAPI